MISNFQTPTAEGGVKPMLVPKLRFPEFREAEGWETGKVDDLVDTVTPPKKLPTTLYASSGAFPIIDQSQSDICGWTNDNEALIREHLPLIVFGDHTCILKLIAKPFAQGADGIKILKTGPKLGTPYLYQFLSYRPVTTEEYKRHYAILKEKIIYFPEFKSGEQQKIAECLSSVDELIAAQARKVDALKTHKKGLMQQLFPREGETQPRLRFPEFENAGEWEEKALAEIVQVASGQVAPTQPPYNGLPQIGSENIESNTGKLVNVKSAGEKGVISGNYLFDENDVLYSKIRPALNKAAAPDFTGICSADIYPIRPANDALLRSYLLYLLLSDKYLEHAIRSSDRGKIPKINREDLLGYVSAIPKPPEQHRIATCLSSLDTLITAETQKYEILKTHKKGLMQQLFPSTEEYEP
jgi:type I restriction enzyme S subunit